MIAYIRSNEDPFPGVIASTWMSVNSPFFSPFAVLRLRIYKIAVLIEQNLAIVRNPKSFPG